MKNKHVKFYAISVMILNLSSLLVSIFLEIQFFSTIIGLVNIAFFILFSLFTYTKYTQSKRRQYQFITNTMHALRTPITKLKGYSNLVEDENNSKYINYMNKELEDLDNMVKQLIKYSIIFEEDGEVSGVCVSDVLFDEYDRVRNLNLKKEIVVNITKDCVWHINYNKLKILISTLVDNQLKYSINYLECKFDGEELVFINDTNLKEGSYESLFKRFKRESTNTIGFGIGLSTVKEIVDLYGMHISANVVDNMIIIKIGKAK